MNVLSSFAQLLSIKDKAPLSVHYSYIEPMVNPIPVEVAKKYFKDENQNLLISHLGLENFSKRVLRNIRIKLKSPLGFDPKLRSNQNVQEIEYCYSQEKLEILVEKIDPGESLYITLFPSPSSLQNDFEPQVIINDELLTRGMKRMGYYMKYPSFLLLNLVLLFVVCCALGLLVWGSDVIEFMRERDSAYVLIKESQDRMNHYSCSMTVIDVKSDFDWHLKKSQMPLDFILKSNNVDSYEELLLRKEVVLCMRKPSIE